MFNKAYSKYYDLFNSEKPYQKEINFVYDWANKPKSILDIGCGTANYWKYYPDGTKLLGIDRSEHMPKRSNGEILCGDISNFKTRRKFDCVTALFDVLNYIPDHDWWKNLPLKKGGYFIFDVWDKKKVDRDGFTETWKSIGTAFRAISPISYDGKYVDLKIDVWDRKLHFREHHLMFLYSHKEIEQFCGNEFEIVEVKRTKNWQTFYKCKRK